MKKKKTKKPQTFKEIKVAYTFCLYKKVSYFKEDKNSTLFPQVMGKVPRSMKQENLVLVFVKPG
jgi:hypothetical protein